MKQYCQIRLWLMLIFSVLVIILLVLACIFCPCISCLICSSWSWTAIGAVSTAFSAITALITYRNKVKIESKQKTYDAIYKFKDDVYCIERMIGRLNVKEVNDLVNEKEKQIKGSGVKSNKWECITKYLTKLEHFATCFNDGIFDYSTVKRMSGDYLIRQMKLLEPVINYKIRENKGMDTYKELLKMKAKLED